MSVAGASPVAVVSGGARRLGRHLCSTLAARGYDLVVLYRNSEDDARSLAEEIAASGQRARALALDVAVEAQVSETFAEIARR
jgi:NAD(P)-dependent dehydrogenase (short-subunit alcohol dehydrogenase family)